MRFGIMGLQIDSLLPPGLPPERVMAHLGTFDHAEMIRGIAGHGFKLIELGGDISVFLPHTFAPPAIDRLSALKAELGLSYTVHLPLWSVEPSTPLAPVRQGSVQTLVAMIQATRPLDPEMYVLHATGALASEFYRMNISETARALILRQFQSSAGDSLRVILAETGLPSRQLAIETIEFPFELTLELAETLDLSICFDTGHVIVGFSGPVDLFDALESCMPRLGEVHLHDGPWQGAELNIGYGKDHRPLGTGDLDIPRLFDRLQAADFCGPIIFELDVEEALQSVDAIQQVRPHLISGW